MESKKSLLRRPLRRVISASAILMLQSAAAIFFLVDSVADVMLNARQGVDFEVVMECVIAFALVAGVVLGARDTRKLLTEAKRREEALEVARGALSDMINTRFDEWRLSAAEAEVALFAIKGCNIPEIAALRNSAVGTVRSQLSQVYAKAGVTSQSMLISVFIDDLL